MRLLGVILGVVLVLGCLPRGDDDGDGGVLRDGAGIFPDPTVVDQCRRSLTAFCEYLHRCMSAEDLLAFAEIFGNDPTECFINIDQGVDGGDGGFTVEGANCAQQRAETICDGDPYDPVAAEACIVDLGGACDPDLFQPVSCDEVCQGPSP